MPKIKDIESIYDPHHSVFKGAELYYFPNRLVQSQRQGSPYRIEWKHPAGKTEEVAFQAQVGNASWLVRCEWCSSAHYVAKKDPWFYCTNPYCQNEPAHHRAVKVVFPDDLADIEELLSLRPRYQTRNWHTGESLGQLVFENAQLGIPVSEKWKPHLRSFMMQVRKTRSARGKP